jgi:hypothetical protein
MLNALIKSHTFTYSIWLRAAAPLTIKMIVQENGTFENTTTVINVTATWTRFSITKAFSGGATGTAVSVFLLNAGGEAAKTLFAWGAQLETGAAATSYSMTTVVAASTTVQTKPWDRRTKNYCLQSQSLDQAPWVLAQSGAAASVITADFVADPNGALTAEKIVFAATAAAQYSGFNQPVVLPAFKGQTVTFSIYLYSAGATTINIIIEDNASLANTTLNANVTVGGRASRSRSRSPRARRRRPSTAGCAIQPARRRRPSSRGARRSNMGLRLRPTLRRPPPPRSWRPRFRTLHSSSATLPGGTMAPT